jgi:hypothetical protein
MVSFHVCEYKISFIRSFTSIEKLENNDSVQKVEALSAMDLYNHHREFRASHIDYQGGTFERGSRCMHGREELIRRRREDLVTTLIHSNTIIRNLCSNKPRRSFHTITVCECQIVEVSLNSGNSSYF